MAKDDDEREHDDGIEARRHLSVRWQDNWYRDVWNFLNTLFLVAVLLLGIGANTDRIDDVQQSRYEFQLRNCLATNARNLAAKAKARDVVSAQGQRSVRILIDALVPFTDDCEARAREGVEISPD
jgi:hypothetical protein